VRIWKLFVLGIVVIVAIIGGNFYLKYTEKYPSTDDAYINADVVHVAAQVAGPVIEVNVANQDYVHQGDRLFTIDPQTFDLAVKQADARLSLARQEVAQDEAAVASAMAEVHNREVLLENATANLHRAQELTDKRYMSQQARDDAEANYKSAQATLALARAKLNESQKKLGTPGEQNDRVQEAKAALGQAQWQLNHTEVTAACDGRIAEFALHRGDTVRVGVPLFVVICDNSFTINANYKETDLGRIRPGQPVDIKVDMYPNHHFKGRVKSINGASGVAFSLLPPQNATGTWVKVTQRVPVKIQVIDPDQNYPFRVGTSAVVTVDTTTNAAARAEKLGETGQSGSRVADIP
jgi:membrane fusion protein (multidrug efflux system)